MKTFVSVLSLVLVAGLTGCSDSSTPAAPAATTGQAYFVGTLTDLNGAGDATVRLSVDYDSFDRLQTQIRDEWTMDAVVTGPVHMSVVTDSPVVREAVSALESSSMNIYFRTRSNGETTIQGSINATTNGMDRLAVDWYVRTSVNIKGMTGSRLRDVFAQPGAVAILSNNGTEIHRYSGTALSISVRGSQRLADGMF